jgi:peptidoglycan-N-acetylglucosamine deacetylase
VAAVLALGGLGGCAGFTAHADTTAAAAVAPDCLKVKCVALTFDDGPGAATSRLLDILAEKEVRATFFVLGKQVKAHPDLVQRAVAEGHQIGDHTWDHKVLTSLPQARVLSQVNRTADAIEEAAGVRPDVMRPPSGRINGEVAQLVGLPAILWSVDTRDWQHRDTEKTVDAAREQATAGGVILMHDIYASTVDAVPRIIDGLRADGYALVTVQELFDSRLRAGKIYHDATGLYSKAMRRLSKEEKAREIEEYLRTNGQPRSGAVPGPVVARTELPPLLTNEDY